MTLSTWRLPDCSIDYWLSNLKTVHKCHGLKASTEFCPEYVISRWWQLLLPLFWARHGLGFRCFIKWAKQTRWQGSSIIISQFNCKIGPQWLEQWLDALQTGYGAAFQYRLLKTTNCPYQMHTHRNGIFKSWLGWNFGQDIHFSGQWTAASTQHQQRWLAFLAALRDWHCLLRKDTL